LGDIGWEPFIGISDWSNGYRCSKWVSEQVLMKLAKKYHMPLTLHRPVRVISSSSTGYIAPQHVLHLLEEFSARREIPSVRGRIGVVAVDYLSSDIAELLLHQHPPGAENNWVQAYNIMYPNGLVSFRQLADLLENRACPSIKTVPFH
jgi:nucleoside-diphosphate-sugar epimerase